MLIALDEGNWDHRRKTSRNALSQAAMTLTFNSGIVLF
jgi:hypothetical protein